MSTITFTSHSCYLKLRCKHISNKEYASWTILKRVLFSTKMKNTLTTGKEPLDFYLSRIFLTPAITQYNTTNNMFLSIGLLPSFSTISL